MSRTIGEMLASFHEQAYPINLPGADTFAVAARNGGDPLHTPASIERTLRNMVHRDRPDLHGAELGMAMVDAVKSSEFRKVLGCGSQAKPDVQRLVEAGVNVR